MMPSIGFVGLLLGIPILLIVVGVVWFIGIPAKGTKRSPINRGILAALITWGVFWIPWAHDDWLRNDPKYASFFVLLDATEKGNKEVALAELNKGANPNIQPPFDDYENYMSPLTLAIQNDDRDMVTLLLEHGADPNISCAWGSAITMAAEDDKVAIMELLPRHNGLKDKDMALWEASVFGKKNAVIFLLAHGADPNQKISPGGAPMFKRVLEGGYRYPEIAKLLKTAATKNASFQEIKQHQKN